MTRIICGPSGGTGGGAFLDEVPGGTTVGALVIRSGDLINSVQFLHVDDDGVVVESKAHGGLGGTARTVPLGENTAIVGISGRYGIFVDFLEIRTAIRDQSGAFQKSETLKFGGKGGAANFFYQAPPGYEIVGFLGRSGKGVDAIGAVFRPLAERGLAVNILAQLPGPLGGGHPLEPGGGPPLEDTRSPATETNQGPVDPTAADTEMDVGGRGLE